MFCMGCLIEGPMKQWWYNKVNPYYMNVMLPKIFPKLFHKPTIFKIAVTSTLIDCFIGDWFHMGILIIFGNLWDIRKLDI